MLLLFKHLIFINEKKKLKYKLNIDIIIMSMI
jgi:hypothetical protein